MTAQSMKRMAADVAFTIIAVMINMLQIQYIFYKVCAKIFFLQSIQNKSLYTDWDTVQLLEYSVFLLVERPNRLIRLHNNNSMTVQQDYSMCIMVKAIHKAHVIISYIPQS